LFVSASFGKGQAAQPAPDLSEIEFLERYCFEEVNRARKDHLLPPLVLSDHLLVVARKFSRRMAEEGFFSHIDPEGRTVKDRTIETGIKFTSISENLLWIRGYLNPVPPAIQRWMSSDGHRRNILAPEHRYSAVGVWIARDGTVYFTVIFID
jgi:uncharacterized protein YkwD